MFRTTSAEGASQLGSIRNTGACGGRANTGEETDGRKSKSRSGLGVARSLRLTAMCSVASVNPTEASNLISFAPNGAGKTVAPAASIRKLNGPVSTTVHFQQGEPS